jgi:cell division protein FtsQ
VSVTSTSHLASHAAQKAALTLPTRRAGIARWFTTVVGLTLVLATAWGVTHSRIFELRTLRVAGNAHLSVADVAAAGAVTGKTNVLWLSTSGLERRLERNPWIKSASVSRSLPALLTIEITERTPVAILAGSRQLVAEDGVILSVADQDVRLPLIDGASSTSAGGNGLPDPSELAVARSLPKALAPLVGRIAVDGSDRLVVVLRDGTRATFGDPENASSKGLILAGLIRWMERTGTRAAAIDLTVPGAPAILPAP